MMRALSVTLVISHRYLSAIRFGGRFGFRTTVVSISPRIPSSINTVKVLKTYGFCDFSDLCQKRLS